MNIIQAEKKKHSLIMPQIVDDGIDTHFLNR